MAAVWHYTSVPLLGDSGIEKLIDLLRIEVDCADLFDRFDSYNELYAARFKLISSIKKMEEPCTIPKRSA